MYSISTSAKYLGIAPATLRRWERKGKKKDIKLLVIIDDDGW